MKSGSVANMVGVVNLRTDGKQNQKQSLFDLHLDSFVR